MNYSIPSNLRLAPIQSLAMAYGIQAPPNSVMVPDKAVVDPIGFRFSIAAGALAIADPVDITGNEMTPAGVGSDGVAKSRGGTSSYVGFINGLSVVLDRGDNDDLDIIQAGYEAVIYSGGVYRVAPFAEALRVGMGRAVSDGAGPALDVATGCPSAPGRPQYPLTGRALAWPGRKPDSIGIRCHGATGTTGATVTGTVYVWGIWMPGESQSVEAGTMPGMPCDRESLSTPKTFGSYLAQFAALSKLVR